MEEARGHGAALYSTAGPNPCVPCQKPGPAWGLARDRRARVLPQGMRVLAWLGCLGVACGGHGGKPAHDDAAVHHDASTTALEVPARPLGLPELASYLWRKRGGQPAFRAARKAENAEDWPAVVAACRQALASDPGHLEASWLLAAALGKLGKLDQVFAPLALAVAGDFGKWGQASLELPLLAPFLATAQGQAWQRRVDNDRATYASAIAHAVVVHAAGDLFAVDPAGPRWYRLTRTFGAVIGALEVPDRIAFITRTKSHVSIGIADLTRGHSTPRPVDIGTTGPFSIAWAPAGKQLPAGFWIGVGAPTTATWRVLDDDAKFHSVPGKATRPPGPWLEVSGRSTRLHRLPVVDVVADWDDKSLASAIRLAPTSRVISVPSPGLIDGNTLTWSPDHARLAFVAQLDEHCTPGAVSAAAFVVDPAAGAPRELERASGGLAVEWFGDRLAIAGDHGVAIVELEGKRTPIDGATGLLATRRAPRCTPASALPDEAISDEPDPESAVGDDATDAGVH